MKKTLIVTSTAVILGTLSLMGGTASQATTYEGSKANIDGTVEFTESKEPGQPVDPGTGGPIEVEPVNPSVSDFKITYASNWDFGKNVSTGLNATYFAKLDHHTVDGKKVPMVPMVSTSDYRGSDRKGWALSVKQDAAFKDESKHELEGAEIVMTNAFTTVNDKAPEISKSTEKLVLSSDAQTIATANATTGIGEWGIGFGEIQTEDGSTDQTTTGLQLNVPGTSVKNKTKYSTTITYELTADPSI